MAGHLERIARVFKGDKKRASVASQMQIRAGETTRTYLANSARLSSAQDRLAEMDLGEAATTDIDIAVRAAMAVQRSEDDILWRSALRKHGLSRTEVNRAHNIKEAIELDVETKTPRFSIDIEDSSS